MKGSFKTLLAIFFLFVSSLLNAQNETRHWYFGANAGLDFSTNPPSILTNGMLNTGEGCATISDTNGNLLFYTDGITVYNSAHAVMANGTGLLGNGSTTQSSIIVKQPGNSNIYFIFTLGASGTGSLCFSTVDLSLASGMGSVTVKNTLLATNMSEKLTAVRHCNGNDVWVISHENNSSNFRTYLVSSAGVSAAIISNVGSTLSSTNQGWLGNLKASPTARKLAMAMSGASGSFEIFDFDNATGIPSNPFNLGSFPSAYGCEFSPDGSKLYGDRESGTNFLTLYQWDLCAGSSTAIASSQYSLAVSSQIMGMQLASDGKIYIAKMNTSTLAVIANPNSSGASCNYNHNGQSIAPKICRYNLPNFMTSYLKPLQPPFSYTSNCLLAQFSDPPPASTLNIGCTAISNSVSGLLWNFGEPASGANNTSTLSNPSHSYAATGTYSAVLIVYSSCSADTIKMPVNIVAITPTLNLAGTFTVCKGEKRTYTVTGANTYTWNTGTNSNTISITPSVSLNYSVNGSFFGNSCFSTKILSITVNKCLGFEETSGDIFNVFPNPINKVLRIDANNDFSFSIINYAGKVLLKESLSNGYHQINTEELPPGIYTLKIDFPKQSRVVKIIKLE